MKIYIPFILSMIFASSAPAFSEEVTFSKTDPGVIPVLISVNPSGDVASLSMAESLRPSYARLLRANVREALNASDRDAGGVRQQYVVQMKLDNRLLGDGRHAVFFRPIAVSPVHASSWHWQNQGAQYRLIQGADLGHGREDMDMRVDYTPSYGPLNSAL